MTKPRLKPYPTYDAYKDSGVDWLGEIPESWSLKKTSYLFDKIGSGTTPSSSNSKLYEGGTINWVQTGDLNDGLITRTNKKLTPLALSTNNTLKTYNAGSLIIA
ncbi:MAG: restriction endonuclease subunit S, partial [Alphaproteobacteria bacterium]|nr:restriction endonuclease subunit S [Alphaproteobacteria bacterium]